MYELIGPTLDPLYQNEHNEKDKEFNETFITVFEHLKGVTRSKKVNSRAYFVIKNLMDLRGRQWQYNIENEGPLKAKDLAKKFHNELAGVGPKKVAIKQIN